MKIYKIAQEGTDLLRREPGKITLEILKQFPAYRRYLSDKAKKAAETRKQRRAAKNSHSTQLYDTKRDPDQRFTFRDNVKRWPN